MPGASLSTSQALPLPVCCSHFNPTAHGKNCTKTMILLWLSLFLFIWEQTSTYQLHFPAPPFYAHIFSLLLLLELKKTSCNSTVTNPPMIPVYIIMTNIFKTLGKKQHNLTHSKLNSFSSPRYWVSFLTSLVLA